MGRVRGRIESVELHPSGPWARVILDGGEKVYIREAPKEPSAPDLDLMRLTETFGSLAPSVLFEFDFGFLMRQVKSYRPIDGTAMDDPARQRETHERYGGRLAEIIAGEHEPARRVDLRTILAGIRDAGACVEEIADPHHGAKNCVLFRGHAGNHLGRCFACWRAVLLSGS